MALSLIILYVVVVLIAGGVYLFRQQIKDFCILQKNKWEQRRKEREAEQERLRQEKIQPVRIHKNICKMIDSWFCEGPIDEITEYLTNFF